MHRRVISNAVVAACGLALALSVGACGKNERGGNTDQDRSARADTTANRGHEGTPVTLTGCLQQGKSNAFILTQVNEPAQKSVGTSGNATAVDREELRAASHAYRLEGDKDDLDKLVGKQVRVTGHVTENSDLKTEKKADEIRKDEQNQKPLDIDADDLAKVDVASVEMTAATCGASANESGAPANRRGAKK